MSPGFSATRSRVLEVSEVPGAREASAPPAGSTIAILAGGAGTRMGGVQKAFLLVEGRRIIDRQLELMRPLFQHIVIVANAVSGDAFADLGVPVIPDRAGPGLGPAAGVDAALAWTPDALVRGRAEQRPEPDQPRATDGHSGDVVCVAGDMPFLCEPLLLRLRDHPPGRGLVPRHANRLEPLCARYPRSVGPIVADYLALASGGRALHRLIASLGFDVIEEPELRTLTPRLRALTNLNTPRDLSSSGVDSEPREPGEPRGGR